MPNYRILFLIFLLSLFAIIMLTASSTQRAGNDIWFKESNCTAELYPASNSKDNELKVSIEVEKNFPQIVEGTLKVRIIDLYDNEISVKEKKLEFSGNSTTSTFTFQLPKIRDEILWYRMEYIFVQYPDVKIRGIKSISESIGQIETRILGQKEFYAGSKASIRVAVYNHNGLAPLKNATVNITLKYKDNTKVLFNGLTDEKGTVSPTLEIPENIDESATIEIKVSDKNLGEDIITENIRIKKVYQIMLTTDKPLYQPSQTIHIRSLSLRVHDLKPASEDSIILEVEDSKGNKVFKKFTKTDKFGIASAEFVLADEINMGIYKIRAILGNNQQEKSVEVKRYVLPKFKIEFSTDKQYYLPGEFVKLNLQSDYFFGKPVSGGKVKITASKFDVEWSDITTIDGTTDLNGHYTTEFQLPDNFVGTPLQQGSAMVKFDITLIDKAEHQEKKTQTVTVSKDPIVITIIPESGKLVPNIENVVYVMTTYPDGNPAETDIEITYKNKFEKLKSNSLGIVEYKITPSKEDIKTIENSEWKSNRYIRKTSLSLLYPLIVKAKDKQGQQGEKSEIVSLEQTKESILLRVSPPISKVGKSAQLSIITAGTSTKTVYIDIIKDNQTLLTKTIETINNKATVDVDLTADMMGTIRFNAYIITQSSNIIRDTKVMYVNPATDLKIGVSLDKQVYLPAEDASITFTVTDNDGHPILSALGIYIVDESVFALSEMQPGMEKIYFTLEKELLEPKYFVKGGFTIPDMVKTGYVPQTQDYTLKETAAKVLLSSASDINYQFNVNTYTSKNQNYQRDATNRVYRDSYVIQKAITEYYRKEGRDTKDSSIVSIDKLISTKYLKKEESLDPWGNPYETSPYFYNGYYYPYYYYLTSYGPDEIKNTDDDITVTGYTYHYRNYDYSEGSKGSGGWRSSGRMKSSSAPSSRSDVMMDEMAIPTGEDKSLTLMTMEGKSDKEKSVRVREYFPETLYSAPAVITDTKGKAVIKLKVADSITTWRITTMASSLTGLLGSTTEGMRVFQDFFVDIDLPVSLTQNDVVSIPIAIYNYLPTSQSIRLKITKEDWFELLSDVEKNITLEKNEVSVAYYTLKVKTIGMHKLTVYAFGTKMSDAISRQIEVTPDGKEYLITFNDRIESDVNKTVSIPTSAIDNASKIFVKIYPGYLTQVVEGMDSMLRMPYG